MKISDTYRINVFAWPLMLAAMAALGSCSDQELAEDGLEDDVAERELTTLRFAVIGDFGQAGGNEKGVAELVKGWAPDLVITTGDNNYPDGTAATIDGNIGQYYAPFIHPYFGDYGGGSPTGTNRFFPTLGNHDTKTGSGQPYLDYFTLYGNERYYDFVRGPVHFFALNSNLTEQDGRTVGSKQAMWLQGALASSDSPWKIVYFHHSPYSSSNHGSTTALQWPFKEWGASIVLTGHDHGYERIVRDGFTYIVNGLGGVSRYSFGAPVAGSVVRYNTDFGAQLVTATETSLNLAFYTRTGALIDSVTLTAGADPDPVPAPDPNQPVTVTFTDAADTYIAEHQPKANFAGTATIKLDGDAPKNSGRDQRGLVRWNIAQIPEGSAVTAASIKLHVQDAAPGETYELYRIARSWSETSVTWSSPWTSAGGDVDATPLGVVGSASPGPLTVDLNAAGLAVVQGWVDDATKNFGLMIYDKSEVDALELVQSESADPTRRPTLTVTYQPSA